MFAREMLCLVNSNLQERRNISKLYMVARGHQFLVCGLGNECALVFSTRERCSNRNIIGLK